LISSGRIAFVMLALGAAGAWWLNQQLEGPGSAAPDRPARAGYYMTEGELSRAGPDGLPEYRVLAERVRQDELDGPTALEQVRIEYGVYTATPWLLTAPRGILSADQSSVELFGGVLISGEVEGDRDTRVETDRLTIDIESNVASTEGEVRLAVGDDWVTAIGMTAYLMEERVQLQSSVHGQFQP